MKKIKYYILIFLIFLIIFNCKSVKPKEQNQSDIESESYEKIKDLSLIGFNYSIDTDGSKIKQKDIYEVNYIIDFDFKYKNDNFKISYILYDDHDNIIYKKENVKPEKDISGKNIYHAKGSFNDIFNYQKIKYLAIVENNNKKVEYTGEYENILIPKLVNFDIGPIISTYIDNKLNVSLSINLKLLNYKGIRWIHLIPPSMDSYWNITFDVDYIKNEVTVNKVLFEESKNYIENGKYLLQLNLNRYGLIQKEIEIIDISGNNNGKNYGLPIINVENIDKNKIQLETLLLDKIDFFEIWLFDKIDSENKKIAYAKIEPDHEIMIDNLIKQFKDDNKRPVKIQYNKEYIFKIYSYSKIINGIKYISISDDFNLTVKKFKLFPF